MEPRTALWTAIVATAAAIAIVATDSVLGLEAKLETRRDGEWEVVWQAPESTARRSYAQPYPVGYHGGCGTEDLRFTVHNKKPIGESVDVGAFLTFNGTRLWQETWDLAGYETRVKEFTVPAWAAHTGPPPKEPGWVAQADIQVYADDTLGWSCVQYGGASR